MIRTSLDGALIADAARRLSEVDIMVPAGRQPVHTCYVPAGRLTPDTPGNWGTEALAAMDGHAELLDALDLPGEILARVRAKLVREPVEDLRIDFEDGYGTHDDAAEDADAHRAATIVADWHRSAGVAWFGIRFKSFHTTASLERGVRTLDVFLTALLASLSTGPGAPPHGHAAPDGLRLTFPKVSRPDQVSVLCDLLELLEGRLDLAAGSLRFEIQIETPRSIVDEKGRLGVPRLIAAGRGRVSGLHFGTYDYTAACGLDAAQQHLGHRACDFARHVMQVGAAGTGVRLCDGSTNLLPVGDAVLRGWQTHYRLVRRSLEQGFHQGWDLHPAQLVTRYAAVYAYYLLAAPESARRLGGYLRGSGGPVAEEPATASALAVTLRRAVDSGALTEPEVTELAGTSAWRDHA